MTNQIEYDTIILKKIKEKEIMACKNTLELGLSSVH